MNRSNSVTYKSLGLLPRKGLNIFEFESRRWVMALCAYTTIAALRAALREPSAGLPELVYEFNAVTKCCNVKPAAYIGFLTNSKQSAAVSRASFGFILTVLYY